MSSPHVDAPGQPQVRVTAGSGSITVVAEPRTDVVADGNVEVYRHPDGSFEVVPARRSRSVTVHCPEGTAVVVGSRSGSLRLSGRLGPVHVTTMSGSVEVEHASTADLRAMSGRITVGTCDGACRVKTKSGSTTVGAAESVDIHIGSGSVNVGRVTGTARVRAVSGTVSVDAEGRGSVEIETMSGSITVTLPPGCHPNVSARSMSGRPRIEIPSGSDCDVRARTMSGRISVRSR